MRRAVGFLVVLLALAGSAAPAAAEWRSQQPPLGPGGFPAPLGEVGDLECWSANRCLLITAGVAGNGGLPAGLYAYDGAGWYLYSTVCGGHQGRIAWAGPTEFWTISDQPVGQEVIDGPPKHISLCHFKDGAVLTSYAQPVGFANSYLPMSAAACLVPDECWFGGDRLPGTTNVGAFHLYWNGLSLLDVPSLTEPQPEIEDPGRSVFGMAYHDGALYESVRVQGGDEAPGEPEGQPHFLHRVLPGSPSEFPPVVPGEPISYGGEGAQPGQLRGFHLSDDGEGLWAVSGAGAAPAEVTALRLGPAGLDQVELEEEEPATFLPGDEVNGLAAEPGAAAAWVGFRHDGEGVNPPARLARVHAGGTVEAPLELPAEGEGVGNKGVAGPVACPEAGQCWMATEDGWLFHLGPDPAEPNTDSALHTLIAYRPPDASLPTVPPTALPEDDSGLFSGEAEAVPLGVEEPLPGGRSRPLVSRLRQKLLGGRVLELSFVLRTRARVRLIARRKGAVVAKTPRYTMGKGPRKLRLRLDPRRWPTKLDLKAKAIETGGSR